MVKERKGKFKSKKESSLGRTLATMQVEDWVVGDFDAVNELKVLVAFVVLAAAYGLYTHLDERRTKARQD